MMKNGLKKQGSLLGSHEFTALITRRGHGQIACLAKNPWPMEFFEEGYRLLSAARGIKLRSRMSYRTFQIQEKSLSKAKGRRIWPSAQHGNATQFGTSIGRENGCLRLARFKSI
jgi:hypothetical protein